MATPSPEVLKVLKAWSRASREGLEFLQHSRILVNWGQGQVTMGGDYLTLRVFIWVPPIATQFLAGARLVALDTSCGSYRPIAVGEVLRRLAAKYLCFSCKQIAGAYFGPVQLGVGIPGGVEAAIHAARLVLTDNISAPGFGLLKIDLKNAFNEVDRSTFLAEVLVQFPSLSCYAQWAYSEPSILGYSGSVLSSSREVQQGTS